jgi:hypothetical protein
MMAPMAAYKTVAEPEFARVVEIGSCTIKKGHLVKYYIDSHGMIIGIVSHPYWSDTPFYKILT